MSILRVCMCMSECVCIAASPWTDARIHKVEQLFWSLTNLFPPAGVWCLYQCVCLCVYVPLCLCVYVCVCVCVREWMHPHLCSWDINNIVSCFSRLHSAVAQGMLETSCISQYKNMWNISPCYRLQLLCNPFITLFIFQIISTIIHMIDLTYHRS